MKRAHTQLNYLVRLLCAYFIALFASSLSNATATEKADIGDLLDLPFPELLNIPIHSTSYFTESALDTASSVSVIIHQDWEKRGARRLDDAIQHLPSVISIPNFLGQSSVRIRGYALADARGVATLWDGVSVNTYNLGTADIDRPNIQINTLNSIEVIRGPGSVLYGTDAFHGVVSLKSYDSDINSSRVLARLGSNGFYSAGFNGSTDVDMDSRLHLSISSSGQPDQNISYEFTGGNGERDYKYQSTTLVTKFESNINKKWSYKLGFYYDDNDSDNFHSLFNVPATDVVSTDTDITMLKADFIYQISTDSDLSLNSYGWVANRKFDIPLSPTNELLITGEERRQLARLLYRVNKLPLGTELSLAIETRRDHIVNQHRTITSSGIIIVDSDLPFSGTTRDITSFLLDGKTRPDNIPWIFHYGFRIDDYSDFGSQFTPRLGVIYKLNNTSVLKALYGQSFRAANAVEVGGTPFIMGDPNIKPEELDTYELVYLKQTHDARYEVTLFHNDLTNGITNVAGQFQNVSESRSEGIELGYSQKFAEFLIESSASYVKSKDVTNDVDYYAFPKYIINLGLGYDFPQHWTLYVNNRIHLDARENTTTNAPDLKDYWRVDVNLRRTVSEQLQIFANIRNALNRDNYLPYLGPTEGGIPEDDIGLDAGIIYKF